MCKALETHYIDAIEVLDIFCFSEINVIFVSTLQHSQHTLNIFLSILLILMLSILASFRIPFLSTLRAPI